MTESPIIYVPGGRYVSGDLLHMRTTNARNQPIPEDKQQYEVGVAIRKDAPGIGDFFSQLMGAAKAVHAANPQAGQVIDAWAQNGMQGFSMKIADGDKPSVRTQQVNPNTAGCFVLYISSGFPFNCYNDQNIQIDPQLIKRGYYVDCTVSVAPNGQAVGDGIGIYVNPGMFRLIGVGEEIKGGINEEAHRGVMPQGAPQLPPGAQPVGSAPPPSSMPPGVAGQPPMQTGIPGQAPAQQPPGVPTQAPAQTAPGVPIGQPPVGGVPQPQMQPGTGTGLPTNQQPQPPYPGIMNVPGVPQT